ncbi:hypothetical protein OAA45_00165 [bacterium]|nr:hypothetical protein [bacterium]
MFEGNAPVSGSSLSGGYVFDDVADDFIIYYISGRDGFTESILEGYASQQINQAYYTVEFVIRPYGTRTGGGELVQTVRYGLGATQPTGDVSPGWSFVGWDAPFNNIRANLVITAFFGYAADNIPDPWQIAYFGESNPLGSATADPDKDGQNNLMEYLTGNSPTDASSVIQVRIEKVNESGLAIVINKVVSGRTYTLESRANLISDWTAVEARTISEDELDFSFTEVSIVGEQTFYRVSISE